MVWNDVQKRKEQEFVCSYFKSEALLIWLWFLGRVILSELDLSSLLIVEMNNFAIIFMHVWIWMVQSDLLEKLDWKNFEKRLNFFVTFLEYGTKIHVEEQHF